jgi:hypothetical protein
MYINDVALLCTEPATCSAQEWIGQQEPLRQLQACWLKLSDTDQPLTPRIVGYPGTGKTTLAMAAARLNSYDTYIMQCTSDTRPEDLLVSPVLARDGSVQYHASPLLSAVLNGGVAILDEGNRMPEKSWASLASLLDGRRMVTSAVAGIEVKAHKEFRAVVTMNEDASTFEVPDYIMSRLQPGIELGFPAHDEEMRILSYHVPYSNEKVLALCVNYLQRAHALDLPFSIRDGINIIQYTLKQKRLHKTASNEQLFTNSIRQILGEEALDLDSLASKRKDFGSWQDAFNLGDLFYGDNDELNPDFGEN